MRVLVACEKSQAVCKAFRKLGHEAYSNDLQECSGGYPKWHIQGDAIKALWGGEWDIVIAHPPCTRLANSGVRWLAERNLWEDMYADAKFFNKFILYGKLGNKIAIENPIPHKHAKKELNAQYSQIIQPWQFGHPETKATCLWLFGLPPLISTIFSTGREGKVHNMTPGPMRTELRSNTYPGIAEAMATQWGNL